MTSFAFPMRVAIRIQLALYSGKRRNEGSKIKIIRNYDTLLTACLDVFSLSSFNFIVKFLLYNNSIHLLK